MRLLCLRRSFLVLTAALSGLLFTVVSPVSAQTPPSPAATCCRCQKAGATMCVRFTGISSCSNILTSHVVDGIHSSNPSLLTGLTCEALTATQCATVASGGLCTAAPIPETALQAALQTPAPAAADPAPAGGSSPAGTTVSGGDRLPNIVPELSIPIPGVSLSPATESGDGVDVPFLAEYISGLYKYAIGISVLVASLMVVFGGFKYVLGATMSSVGDGKKMIEDAIGGFVVLLCAYVILYLINPDLVNLRTLHLTAIRPVSVTETGSFEELGAYNGEPGAEAADMCNIPNGGYYAQMWQVCRGQDGSSLSQPDQLVRLKEIVDVWKRFGIDQSGGVYVRGGNRSCSPRNLGSDPHQGRWVFKELKKFATKTPPQIDLTQSALAPNCIQSILTHDPENKTAPLPEECFSPAWTAYNTLIVARYRAAGLYCADCILNVRNIYDCFNNWESRVGEIHSHTCHEAGSNGNTFNLRAGASDAQIRAALSTLRFGDGMVNSGHAWLYTGGAGLGYEIMEMGGTGDPHDRIGPNSGDMAKRHAGFAISGGVGGMAVYRSAEAFLREKVRELDATDELPCVNGFRVIHDIPDNVYTSLPSLPFTPFAPHPVTTPPTTALPQCRQSASATTPPTSTGASAGPVTCEDQGSVKRCFFNYQPNTDPTWQPNESFVLIPNRLFDLSQRGSVNAHLYVHLHGHQASGDGLPPQTAGYSGRLLMIAQQYTDQDVNIIIAAPHNRGTQSRNYMTGFNLQTFGTAATAAINAALTQNHGTATNLHLVDAVVGGHSAATCSQRAPRGDKILSQARGASIGGTRVVGVVAYDGCMGYPADSDSSAGITLSDIAAGSQSVLVVPEVATSTDGMGRGTTRRTQRMAAFGPFTSTSPCESYITPDDVLACYKRRNGAQQVVIDEVDGKGHSDSVVCGLGYAFHMFFPGNNGRPLSGRVTCS